MTRDEVISITSNCPIFNVGTIKKIDSIVWEDEKPVNTVVGMVRPMSFKLVLNNANINTVALDLMINGTNNWRKMHRLPMRRNRWRKRYV